jgi:hypothetical protein
MTRVQRLYSAIQAILQGNDRLLQMINRLVAKLELDGCGDPTGATAINAAVEDLYKAAEDRLNGIARDNTALFERYKVLLSAIDRHERFLRCFDDMLDNILKQLTGGLIGTKIIAALSNMVRMAKTLGSLHDALKNLKFSIADKAAPDYTLYDALYRGVQCILLQCNNPFITQRLKGVNDELARRKAISFGGALTLGSLQENTGLGGKTGNNARLQALLRLIQALQRLTSLDLETLCNIDAQSGTGGLKGVGAVFAQQRAQRPQKARSVKPSLTVAQLQSERRKEEEVARKAKLQETAVGGGFASTPGLA